jgi:hypothetical protein
MISQAHEYQTNDVTGDWMESLEHLIRWIAPRTAGRERVMQRLADVRNSRREMHPLRDALCMLYSELDTLYPRGPVISLARRRVRDLVLTLEQTQS